MGAIFSADPAMRRSLEQLLREDAALRADFGHMGA
jgi:hypothetical protein